MTGKAGGKIKRERGQSGRGRDENRGKREERK
jgi:hypothetical protein